MTFTQWRRALYRRKRWIIAQAQCELLGYWLNCKHSRCQRKRRCLFPHPCYWERKQQMSDAERARAQALCAPLRELMSIGSSKGSEGLWLF
jgi:hypothetical protein